MLTCPEWWQWQQQQWWQQWKQRQCRQPHPKGWLVIAQLIMCAKNKTNYFSVIHVLSSIDQFDAVQVFKIHEKAGSSPAGRLDGGVHGLLCGHITTTQDCLKIMVTSAYDWRIRVLSKFIFTQQTSNIVTFSKWQTIYWAWSMIQCLSPKGPALKQVVLLDPGLTGQ